MFPVKFHFILKSGFRGEDFYKLANQKQEFAVAAIFVNRSGHNENYLHKIFHGYFSPSCGSFGNAISDEKILKKIDQSETIIACGGHVC